MNIERAGITFDIHYSPATRGGRFEQPDPADIEIHDWFISSWDDLADMHGAKGDRPIIRGSVAEMVEAIIDREYSSLVEDAESAYYSDFDVPDDGEEYDKYEYEGI